MLSRKLYTCLLYLRVVFLRALSVFSKKIRTFFKERAQFWEQLEKNPVLRKRPLLWIHVASPDEFEYIKLLLQLIRKNHPEVSLLLTFFSLSGYSRRVDFEQVDGVSYLPLDFLGQMQSFLGRLQPVLGLVIKHEFWPNMCYVAQKERIPLLSIGAAFRADQVYFFRATPVGDLLRVTLRTMSALLVPDVASARLLRSIDCQDVEVVGDPRYDSVQITAAQEATFPLVDRFRGEGKKLVIWGRLYPDEWSACAEAITEIPELQHIVAPYQLSTAFLARIRARLPNQVLRYSAYEEDSRNNISSPRVLLIDNIDILSRMYRCADLAYVGGGKRGALQNILEPAVYGVPVLFWDHRAHVKCPEAEALRQCGGALVVNSKETLLAALRKWTQATDEHKQASRAAAKFVAGRLGTTQKIYKHIKEHPSFKQAVN